MERKGRKTVSVRKRRSMRARNEAEVTDGAEAEIAENLTQPEDEAVGGRKRRGRLFHVPTPAPVRFLTRARQAAEELPLAGEAFKRLRETEDWALAELKYRLDGMGEAPASETELGSLDAAKLKFAGLLHSARYNSTQQARELLYLQVLEQMVPEQVRMLAVIADSRPTVMCHVDAGPPVGPTSRRVLAFATSAGKDAGVTLRDHVPRLIQHMASLGLVEEDSEIKGIKAQYELLETEDTVRAALKRIKDELRQWPRIQRRSLRLTPFGVEFWRDLSPFPVAEVLPEQLADKKT